MHVVEFLWHIKQVLCIPKFAYNHACFKILCWWGEYLSQIFDYYGNSYLFENLDALGIKSFQGKSPLENVLWEQHEEGIRWLCHPFKMVFFSFLHLLGALTGADLLPGNLLSSNHPSFPRITNNPATHAVNHAPCLKPERVWLRCWFAVSAWLIFTAPPPLNWS